MELTIDFKTKEQLRLLHLQYPKPFLPWRKRKLVRALKAGLKYHSEEYNKWARSTFMCYCLSDAHSDGCLDVESCVYAEDTIMDLVGRTNAVLFRRLSTQGLPDDQYTCHLFYKVWLYKLGVPATLTDMSGIPH